MPARHRYAYNYDGVGNRTGTSLGTPNLVNEYSNLGYNSRGDLTSDGSYKYGYDALDRLISVTPVSPTGTSTQEQYGYDSQGRRLWKDVYTWNATSSSWVFSYTRTYVWDGNNLAAELDGNGNLVIRYIYGPTGLIAEQDYPADSNYSALLTATGDPSGQPVTIVAVSDLSGNVDELVDVRNGTIVGEFRYDPWGNVLSAAGTATNLDGFRGKGYWVDAEVPWIGESPQPGGGMPHAFNFALEIWMQRDRADQSQIISVTGLPFGNDPINNIDPDGLAAVPVNSAWHHLLSKVVFDAANRASYLNELGMTLADGVDIHSAEWGWMVPSDYHNPVLHSNANELEATWQVSDRAWLRALRERGVTTITRQMLATHVADMEKAYGLDDCA